MPLRVSIFGTGYVGLVSAACFAEHGHDVTCVDIDQSKVDAVNAKRSFLHEPALEELLANNVPQRLRATTDLAVAVRESDVTLIAVPTPFTALNGEIDLSFVLQAATQVGELLREKSGFHAVVVKSTCVSGTSDGPVREAIELASGKTCGEDVGIGVCPEFLSEGTAVDDFLRTDRVVIGASDERTRTLLRELHSGFTDVPFVETNPRTAEAIKYASNALLAVCVSFANEVADMCEAVGDIDANTVIRGVHLSRYLTENGRTAPLAAFLMPGCGYGGSCLPKDVAAIVAHGQRHGLSMPLLSAVRDVNVGRAGRLISRLADELDELAGKRVAVLGTAFKPGTADLRTSPAEAIIDSLREQDADIVCFDPLANEATRAAFDVNVADTMEAAIESADAIVIVTAWPEFAALPELIAKRDPAPVVADGRRMIRPESVRRYIGIGLADSGASLRLPAGMESMR